MSFVAPSSESFVQLVGGKVASKFSTKGSESELAIVKVCEAKLFGVYWSVRPFGKVEVALKVWVPVVVEIEFRVTISVEPEDKFPVQEKTWFDPPSMLYVIVAEVKTDVPTFFNDTWGENVLKHLHHLQILDYMHLNWLNLLSNLHLSELQSF